MKILVGLHALFGELATVLVFLWVFVELLNPSEQRIRRAKIVAMLGLIVSVVSWVIAGWYYVGTYGAEVKPIIKAGPLPWAHGIVMETKEHVFLFIPFLIALTATLITKYQAELVSNSDTKRAVLQLSVLIVLLGLAMVAMGFIISTGARAALEVG